MAEEYIEYIAQISLVLIAISAAYLFNPSNLLTAGVFIFVPILFGYTAYVSSDEFRKSSLLSVFAFSFLIIDKLALLAIIIGVGNPLISLLSNGNGFKDYYKSISIPMLLTGLVLGAAVFGAASQDPEIREQVQNTASDIVSSQTSEILEETQLIDKQRQANKRMVRQTSKATIVLTQREVLNNTKDFSAQDRRTIIQSFEQAEKDVPQRLVGNAENRSQAINISERSSQAVSNIINKDNLILLVPAIAFGFYALHPILGLLTAIFGSFFSYIERKSTES